MRSANYVGILRNQVFRSVPQGIIILARIVLQQLATEAKPRTKLTDYRDRSDTYTRQVDYTN